MRARVEPLRIGGKTVERPFTVDIDEPTELGGGNAYPNPQEHLIAALNACMMVGYVVLCALHGIALKKLEIQTQGDIDLRGFFGLDDSIPAGYRSLTYTVRIKGDASEEQFTKIHEMVMATSPNYYNITRSVTLKANSRDRVRERTAATVSRRRGHFVIKEHLRSSTGESRCAALVATRKILRARSSAFNAQALSSGHVGSAASKIHLKPGSARSVRHRSKPRRRCVRRLSHATAA